MANAHSWRLTGWRIHVLDIPLKAPVHWAGHAEDRIDVVLLDVSVSNGARGVAEMAVRQKWHGENVQAVVAALDKQLLPALANTDISSDTDFVALLTRSTRSALARALADMAREDILAQMAGLPLQQSIARGVAAAKAKAADRVDFSCTITRAAPDAMARQAAQMVADVQARAFKIKTGQGIDTDTLAVAAIRQTGGPDAVLSADSNSAGPAEIVGAMADMLAGQGVAWFEDPCRLLADETFVAVRNASRVPVLVDNASRSLPAAQEFLSLGARGLSVKIMKTGISESLAIARAAAACDAQVTAGICAATSLSALYSLSLFAALPPAWQAMPCEETFFLSLSQDLLREPLQFDAGAIVLPAAGPLSDRLDWDAIGRCGAVAATSG